MWLKGDWWLCLPGSDESVSNHFVLPADDRFSAKNRWEKGKKQKSPKEVAEDEDEEQLQAALRSSRALRAEHEALMTIGSSSLAGAAASAGPSLVDQMAAKEVAEIQTAL